jgi:hypothetical protein
MSEEAMGFGEALDAAKQGLKIRRPWKAPEMAHRWLEYDTKKQHLVLCCVCGRRQKVRQMQQEDLLAEDWEVVVDGD